jgi:hypothetical protein
MQRIPRALVNHPIALLATFLAMAGMLVYGVPDVMPPLRAEKTAPEKVLPLSGTNKDVEVLRDVSTLPPQVARMRGAILGAAATGEVREVMAVLIQLFRTGFVRKGAGTENELYVWPYFAEMPLNALTPAQEVELLTLVTPARMKEMRQKGTYDHFRLTIARDGTWHSFMKP